MTRRCGRRRIEGGGAWEAGIGDLSLEEEMLCACVREIPIGNPRVERIPLRMIPPPVPSCLSYSLVIDRSIAALRLLCRCRCVAFVVSAQQYRA